MIWVKGDQILLVEITICEKVLENRKFIAAQFTYISACTESYSLVRPTTL